MNLPENENLGKAVNEAMKGIEEANEDLRGVLPQDYTSLSKKSQKTLQKEIAIVLHRYQNWTKQSQKPVDK